MKNLFLIPAFTICSSFAFAQYYYNGRFYTSNTSWHLGTSIGAMNCLTDLGGKNSSFHFLTDVDWKNIKPTGSICLNVLYNHVVGLRLGFSLGKVTASDGELKQNPANQTRLARNLSFKSEVAEGLLLTDIYPLEILANGLTGKLTPYMLCGIGVYHFNPMAKLDDKWLNLQPLHTEGQGFKAYPERENYCLTQVNLPFGAGLSYPVSEAFFLSFEIVYRKLFTDYLDDVSKNYINPEEFHRNLPGPVARLAAQMANRQEQNTASNTEGYKRGNPSRKDAYFSININFKMTLGRDTGLKP